MLRLGTISGEAPEGKALAYRVVDSEGNPLTYDSGYIIEGDITIVIYFTDFVTLNVVINDSEGSLPFTVDDFSFMDSNSEYYSNGDSVVQDSILAKHIYSYTASFNITILIDGEEVLNVDANNEGYMYSYDLSFVMTGNATVIITAADHQEKPEIDVEETDPESGMNWSELN